MKNLFLYILCCIFSLLASSGKAQYILAHISTVAGNGTAGYSGDGGPAAAAELNHPTDVQTIRFPNYLIADSGNYRIRQVNSGIISAFAGNGIAGYSGDGGPATSAEMRPYTLEGFGPLNGNNFSGIHIAEPVNNVIRFINASDTISTYAGDGIAGFSGDGGPATAAELNFPTSVCDGDYCYYIADDSNNRIRSVNSSGIITTIAGNGFRGFSGDGGPASAAEFNDPVNVSSDGVNIYIVDRGNQRIRMINGAGIISTLAGNGIRGKLNNTPATSGEFNNPTYFTGISLNNHDMAFISEGGNSDIRGFDSNLYFNPNSGLSTAVDTSGIAGFNGDGGLMDTTELNNPVGVSLTVDSTSFYYGLYIADAGNNRIRFAGNILVAVQNVKSENIVAIYPNPAKSNLTINLSSINGKVILTVFNLFGEQVLYQTSKNKQILNLNIATLPDGLYIVHIQTEDGISINQKFEIAR